MNILLPLFIIFTIAFRPLMPLLDYAANYQNIIDQKCENRMKPELSCNGKCYLQKKLAKTADQNPAQNQKSGSIFTAFTDTFLATKSYNFPFEAFINDAKPEENSYTKSIYNFSLKSRIFHPPLINS